MCPQLPITVVKRRAVTIIEELFSSGDVADAVENVRGCYMFLFFGNIHFPSRPRCTTTDAPSRQAGCLDVNGPKGKRTGTCFSIRRRIGAEGCLLRRPDHGGLHPSPCTPPTPSSIFRKLRLVFTEGLIHFIAILTHANLTFRKVSIDDLCLDAPAAVQILANFVSRAIVDEVVIPSFFK